MPKVVRIGLDEVAIRNVEAMVAELKKGGDSHIKLNPSRVASVALRLFFEKYFDKEKNRIIETLLDKKAVLLSLIEGLDDSKKPDQLDALLKIFRAKSEPKGNEIAEPKGTMGGEN